MTFSELLNSLPSVSVKGILSQIERVVYDTMNQNSELMNPTRSLHILSNLHRAPGALAGLSNYLKVRTKDPVVLGVQKIISAVEMSENPMAILQEIVDEQLPTVTETALESSFFDGLELGNALPQNTVDSVRSFFRGDKSFATLSEAQQKIVEAMKNPDSLLDPNLHEQVSQLEVDLVDEGVLSMAELRGFQDLAKPFSEIQNYTPSIYAEPTEQNILKGLTDVFDADEIRANLAFGAEGVMMKESWLKQVALKQLKGLPLGMAIAPIVGKINEANATAGSFVNIGLGMYDFLSTLAGGLFDPIALGTATITEFMKIFNEAQERAISNQDPTDFQGKMFGYVKVFENGVPTWQPAVLHAVESSTSLGSHNKKLVFETGDELIWVSDSFGNLTPHFTNPVRHSYDAKDDDIVDPRYFTKQGMQQRDYMREWYLLPKNEQVQVGEGMFSENNSFVPQQIKGNAFENKLNQWAAGMNVVKDFVNKPIAEATGTNVNFWNEYSASRPLQAQKWDYWGGNQFLYWLRENYSRTGLSDDEVQRRAHNWEEHPENKYLLNTVFFDSLRVLLEAQKANAGESPYKLTKDGWSDAKGAVEDVTRSGRLTKHEQSAFSQLYQGPDVATPQSAQELYTALSTLGHSKEDQFVAAKTINRFWVNQIVQAGGAEELRDYVTQSAVKTETNVRGVGGVVTQYVGDEYEEDSEFTPASLLQKDVFPWANVGEGLLPSDIQMSNDAEEWNAQYIKSGNEFRESFEKAKQSLQQQKDDVLEEAAVDKKRIQADERLRDQERQAEQLEQEGIVKARGKDVEQKQYAGYYIETPDGVKEVKDIVTFDMDSPETWFRFTDGTKMVKDPFYEATLLRNKPLEAPEQEAEPEREEPTEYIKSEEELTVDQIVNHLLEHGEINGSILTYQGRSVDLTNYLEEAHGIKPDEEVPEYIGRDEKGNIDLYGDVVREEEGGNVREAIVDGEVARKWSPMNIVEGETTHM